MTFRVIPLGLFLSIALIHSSTAETRIRDDMGGSIGRYLRMFAAIRDSGERVVIDGNCFSACTLVIAMIPKERICITERAALGFHAGWISRQSGRPVVNAVAALVPKGVSDRGPFCAGG